MALVLPDWITQEMWCQMVGCNMSLPVPLIEADITKPFVYDRKYGVFYVSRGSHQAAMSLLLALHKGFKSGVKVAEFLKLDYSSGTADYYLENVVGTAFLSSVSKKICVGKKQNLNELEKEFFSIVEYIL